jgi:sodium/hydrogen exchanger-like protein 6/7/sodium/hydrogen exchanger 8
LGLASWNYLAGSYALSWTFIALELVICAVGRFSSVFILSGLFYLIMKKKWKVNFYELGIVWFAGIIRGSVAFALILTVPIYSGY